jgi:hypothetical protein
MADRPRTFEDFAAAEDPAEEERMERGEHYRDPTVTNPLHANVWLLADRHGADEWRVEYQDDDGGYYVTRFSGEAAEERACQYFEALRAGHLSTRRHPAFH